MEPFIKLEPIFRLEFKTSTDFNGTFFELEPKIKKKVQKLKDYWY
jgi:hypothetical protein